MATLQKRHLRNAQICSHNMSAYMIMNIISLSFLWDFHLHQTLDCWFCKMCFIAKAPFPHVQKSVILKFLWLHLYYIFQELYLYASHNKESTRQLCTLLLQLLFSWRERYVLIVATVMFQVTNARCVYYNIINTFDGKSVYRIQMWKWVWSLWEPELEPLQIQKGIARMAVCTPNTWCVIRYRLIVQYSSFLVSLLRDPPLPDIWACSNLQGKWMLDCHPSTQWIGHCMSTSRTWLSKHKLLYILPTSCFLLLCGDVE